MRVDIFSRVEAEKLIYRGFPKNTAVICFYDPLPKKTKPYCSSPDYLGKCERFFKIPLHDIDIEILEDYGLTYDTYFPEAKELAEFIKSCVRDGLDIICQCEYGQSRSAACAAAIMEFYEHNGISVFANYKYYPNQLVFNKVLEALKAGKDIQ